MSNTLTWHKSSYSDHAGNNCVEVATPQGRVLVRDSKSELRGGAPQLTLTRPAWATFIAELRGSSPERPF